MRLDNAALGRDQTAAGEVPASPVLAGQLHVPQQAQQFGNRIRHRMGASGPVMQSAQRHVQHLRSVWVRKPQLREQRPEAPTRFHAVCGALGHPARPTLYFIRCILC